MLNIILLLSVALLWNRIPFQAYNYQHNSHHFLPDPRAEGGRGGLSLFRALGQYDAQWYLRIAQDGYSRHPRLLAGDNKTMEGLTYAFFPLYPLVVSAANGAFHHIEWAAFVVSELTMTGAFLLFIALARGIIQKDSVLFTALLFFFLPFSIFFRSYVPEGLFLLLLLAFARALAQKKYLGAALFLGLSAVTKPNSLLLFIFLLYKVFCERKRLGTVRISWIVLVLITPLACWMGYSYFRTGNPLYFVAVRNAWQAGGLLSHNIIAALLNFFRHPAFHMFHSSLLDIAFICIHALLLLRARGKIDADSWVIWFSLWLFPLLTTDTMSYTKYQTVFYPAALYIGPRIAKPWRGMVLACSIIGLVVVSLFFVNWWWIG